MGTNYYVQLPAKNKCNHCQREDEPEEIHIGKFSFGWKFGFHPRFKTWNEWYDFLLKNVDHIYDEYGDKKPIVDFIEMVENAQAGIWIYDDRNPDRQRYELDRKYEFLDPHGYRIINAEEFS